MSKSCVRLLSLLLALCLLFPLLPAGASAETDNAPSFTKKLYCVTEGKELQLPVSCQEPRTTDLTVSIRLHNGTVLAEDVLKQGQTRVKLRFTVQSGWPARTSLELWAGEPAELCDSLDICVTDPEYTAIRGNYNRRDKAVGLSFDCAYGDTYTNYILDTLDSFNAHATFFMTGKWMSNHQSYMLDMIARGNELGNHSMTHPRLPTLPLEERYEQIAQANERLLEITGVPTKLFRPPYGAAGSGVCALCRYLGCDVILWGVDSHDWDDKYTAERIIRRVIDNVEPGDIILFHNGAANTRKTLVPILTWLTENGYRLLSVSELLHAPTPRLVPDPKEPPMLTD